MPDQPKNYVAIAKRYAEGVVSGKILACDWVKKACWRQLDDLKRQKDKHWPYRFDAKKAARICRFAEGLRHIEGEWASRNETLRLEPWQCFIYTTVFGWVHKAGHVDPKTGRDLTGKRRFRIAYNEMARKNGKSTLSAPVGVYLMAADDEAGAQVYSAATTRDQAKVIWGAAKKMVERDPLLRQAFNVGTSAHSIFQTSSGSSFKALTAEGNSLDGLNIHGGLIDELHAHRTPKVYEVIESARGSRLQPLLWLITTAGFDRSGICYRIREYATKILSGVQEDDTFFAIIYTLDADDDWRDEAVWLKANPNLDVSVYTEQLRPEAAKAASMPQFLTNFLTKHLSVWVNASVNLFNVTAWNELADPTLRPEQFKHDPCWLALDFAPRNDFTSRVQLFRREEDDGTHYYVFARHFLSEGKVQESENASYQGWAREGWIRTNPGNQTSTAAVAEDLIAIVEEGYQIQELDFDPSRTQGIEEKVSDEVNVTLVEVPQMPSKMCPPTEFLSALIADGKIHHNGDPVLAWMLSNVIGRPAGNWGVYPTKERPENKIDGISALLTALSRAMTGEPSSGSIYDSGDVEVWL